MNKDKSVQMKALKIMNNIIQYMEESGCAPEKAWNVVKTASNLTEEQMAQCALIAIYAKK